MGIVRKLVMLAMMAVAATALAAPSAFAASASQHDGASFEPELPHTAPELQIREETSNFLCPAVTPAAGTVPSPHIASGGCKGHVRGNAIRFVGHLSTGAEFVVFTCDIEFEVRIDSTGQGWITHQELTDVTPLSCPRHPCPELPEPIEPAETKAWGISLREVGPVAPSATATLLLCLSQRDDEHGPQLHCELEVPFTETEAGVATNHRYHFNANPNDPVTGGIPCHSASRSSTEILGEFNTEMVNSFGGPEGGVAEHRIEINHT